MPGLIGKKLGMTSVFVDNGKLIPVTVVEAGPCQIVSIKTKVKDGYEALTLGFGNAKDKNLNKPKAIAFKKKKLKPSKYLKEFRNFNIDDFEVGNEVSCELFEVGEKVKASGRSKGKGFQGVVKRHGFAGVGDATHGQHNRLRAPGSLGAGSTPSKVMKGMRMAGRTGSDRVKTVNLQILKIIPEKNLILVSGSVAGAKNSIVILEK